MSQPVQEFVPTPKRFLLTAQQMGDRPAYFTRGVDGWQPTNWLSYQAQVQQAARALVALGVQPGQAVCVLGFNRPEWVIMDLAAMMIGAVAAGIYWTSAPGEVEYVISHSGAAVLLAEDQAQWEKVQGRLAALPKLQKVVMMQGAPTQHASQMSWEDFMALGDIVHQAEVDQRLGKLQPGDLGTLIYTSGTTGAPKAVMLSHGNLAWTGMALAKAFGSTPQDRVISYLPLAHVAEQLGSIHNHVAIGYALYFAQSLESLRDHLAEVRPTVFFGVPRVWEKIHAGIAAKLAGASGTKAKLAAWALSVGRQWHATQLAGETPGLGLRLQKRLAARLVHRKVHAALGLDCARLLISAAAPISPATLTFFTGLDLVVREGYGQSEDCGPTSFSLEGSTRIGAVGKPLQGTEVRVAEDGEILVRGPHVFQGYLGMPEETEKALAGGWLHSGDLGRIDEEGYIFITGRKKDLLITSGGKNISPANIEAELMDVPLIEHAVVCGDGRHFLTALIALNPEVMTQVLRELNLGELSAEQAIRHPQVLQRVQTAVDHVNQGQSRVAWIRKFTVLPEALSIDSGALTATMKIRRKAVQDRYRDAIDAMYSGAVDADGV